MAGCDNHKDMQESIKENRQFTIDSYREVKNELTGRMNHMEEGLRKDISNIQEKLSEEIKDLVEDHKEAQKEREQDRQEFIETRTWVKSLFGQFEKVIEKMDEMTDTMKTHEISQAAEEAKTAAESTSSNKFMDQVRKLGYKVIEWVVITLVLGTIITQMTK